MTLGEKIIAIRKAHNLNQQRAFIITLAVLISVTAGFFLLLHYVSQPTPDGKRINSNTSVRMLVNLPDAAPSSRKKS